MQTISDTFLTLASNTLADTENGFSASMIVSFFTSFSVDFNVDLPHHSIPFSTNKRTAFLENLRCFSPEQQYHILTSLCNDVLQSSRPEVKKLSQLLKQRYGMLDTGSITFDRALAADTSHWLSRFPNALECYEKALEKRRQGIYERNLLDDLRLSLELLLKSVLKNDKSLENQLSHLGSFVSKIGGTKEFCNMFVKLIDYYSKYQNEHVKHNDKIVELEIDFMVDITSAFMKTICRYA